MKKIIIRLVRRLQMIVLVSWQGRGHMSRSLTLQRLGVYPKPRIRSYALENKIEGYVLLQYSVFESGKVGNIQVLESDPNGIFEASAINSMERAFYLQSNKIYNELKRRIIFNLETAVGSRKSTQALDAHSKVQIGGAASGS